ncbi:MAG: NAD+ synthase [Gomphosphaeria aponina SAG 52.96 = DSM 107014]|uniref:Glutamine-dependent NAD(+) synthetase n=1 Tax=Gomphosphaeria aponina SAG 52.96 = DSM 107014 TaxID=1521640 RepID=A0A941JVG5_9CHRO|nr:NAD+ synthase [Gomphosphaeria aponina SAG 52.96 = DSM 107014]
MKIAIAQLNPTIGDLSGNAKKILEAAQQATWAGVHLLLTPELSLCGYPPRDLLLTPRFVDLMQIKLEELAQQIDNKLTILVGTVTPNPEAVVRGEKRIYNSIALLQGGKIQQVFHKRLLPTYDVFDEDRYFQSGGLSTFFALPQLPYSSGGGKGINLGVTICEDLWNDEEFWGKRNYKINPIEELAQLGVDLIVNLSASPYTVGKQKLREAMLGHVAIRYQLPIIYANQVGGNDDLIFDGNSVALNKMGKVICRAKSFQEDLVSFEYQGGDLLLGEIKQLPETEDEEIWRGLVLGVKDYARKCGFSQVILGLSGGIDSALVAAIAAEAVGADNVLGVLMPSPYSSEHSVKDAEDLVQNLGIKSEKLPIGETMKIYDRVLEPLFAGTSFGVAEENIQSRIRGNLLMAIANKFGYLLLSTGNKSEMAVGYCTLYGDMNGGLAVIADVPKTRVFSLCRWFNREQEVIPNNVIIKPPSAELKPGQVDQDSLPPYDILDDILYRIINQHQSRDEIIAAGHYEEVVNQVMRLVFRAEFKRKQAPPGLKITDRAFGTGWRMPIASRWLI